MIFPLVELTDDYGIFPAGAIIRFNPQIAARIVKDGKGRYKEEGKKGGKLGKDRMVKTSKQKG